MNKMIFILVLLFNINALASVKLKVAVIDTGLDLTYNKQTPLCNKEHKDFTGEGINDTNGHGTNVIGLIVNTANVSNYCIVIIKAFGVYNKKVYLFEALEYAHKIKADIINVSAGGFGVIHKERDLILKILDSKKTLIVAAGNNNLNLDLNCVFYPACYDPRIYVIGNIGNSTNYGKIVDMKINGNWKTAFGKTYSGTSQSAAIFTGKLLKQVDLLQKKN